MSSYDPSNDYYEVLEVLPSSSFDDIKSNFRTLVLAKHPDRALRSTGSEAKDAAEYIVLQRAYDTLRNKEARTAYDKQVSSVVGNDVNLQPNQRVARQVFTGTAPISH